MKFFERGEKHNWIDDNNRFVGYDVEPQCCEDADYSVTRRMASIAEDMKSDDEVNLEPLFFADEPPEFRDDYELLEHGGMVSFRLVDSEGNTGGYLHLWNAQNGYYSHGFESWSESGTL